MPKAAVGAALLPSQSLKGAGTGWLGNLWLKPRLVSESWWRSLDDEDLTLLGLSFLLCEGDKLWLSRDHQTVSGVQSLL